MMIALQKMRARKTPANQAHVTIAGITQSFWLRMQPKVP